MNQSTRATGWYRIRTKNGWQDCFYWNGWKLDSWLFVIEVEEGGKEI